jgi:hypothetical protein
MLQAERFKFLISLQMESYKSSSNNKFKLWEPIDKIKSIMILHKSKSNFDEVFQSSKKMGFEVFF